MNDSEVDEAMEAIYPDFRWTWCESGVEHACPGSANCEGFPFSRFRWWLWTIRHPEPNFKVMEKMCDEWAHKKHRKIRVLKRRTSSVIGSPLPKSKYGASDKAKPVFQKPP